MFYSQMLLSKKGPLGTVWIAAHCYRKLKKDQVQQTNISSSVDIILEDEVSAHRILAYLLLGVVRIYSKKVEYLFHDCKDVVDKLCESNIGKSTHVTVGFGGESSRTHHSVKRPKRFELDAFDFQISEHRNVEGRNVRPPETLMRKEDGLGEEENMSHLLCKEKMLLSPHREDSTTSHTPPRDVLSPHSMEREMYVGLSRNMNDSASNSDIFRETSFSLEDRLEPMVLDEAEEELMHEKSSTDCLNNHDNNDYGSDTENRTDSVPVLEKDQGIEISLADPVKTMVVDETEKDQLNDKRDSLTEKEPHKSTKSVDETPPVSNKRCRKDGQVVSITVDVTPDLKIADHAVGAQDCVAVPTPAPRESRKILKRRKILYDSTLVVSNKAYKDWMKNARDLIRNKPTAPHTRLQAWRAHILCRFPESFLEPLIPSGISMDICSMECEKKTTGSETLANQDDVSSPVVQGDRIENSEVRDTETRKFPEDAPVAPETPITQVHLNSSRLHDEAEVVAADSHHDGTTSLPSNNEMQLDGVFYTEEANSSDGDSRQSDGYSARTRMAEGYLRQKFDNKKKMKEVEVLNLSQILSRKTKKESARLFYEILVLKTLDRVDVQQECAYGDICVSKTSKFQA